MVKTDAEFEKMTGVPASGVKNKGITKAILATIPERGKGAASFKEVMAAVVKVDAGAKEKGVLNTLYVLRKNGKVEMHLDEKEKDAAGKPMPYYRRGLPKAAVAPAAPAKK